MAKYTGKAVTVSGTPAEISAKFADLTVLEAQLDKLSAEQRARIGDLRFTPDSIVMTHPQTGEIHFGITDRDDNHIDFKCDGMLPIAMTVRLKAVDDAHTELSTEMDIDIPLFLRPVIGPHLQKAVDQMSDMMGRITE